VDLWHWRLFHVVFMDAKMGFICGLSLLSLALSFLRGFDGVMTASGHVWVEGQRHNEDKRMRCPEVPCSCFTIGKYVSETRTRISRRA